MRTKSFLFFILFLFSAFAFGQKQEFEHLSDKDGLVNSSVTSILKDSYGYMWFGTYNGLSRYDGYGFTNFLNETKNDSSITDNRIRFLLESRKRTLFVAFQFSGFCIFNRATETFSRFRHDPKNPNSLSHDYVLTFYEDANENFWIGTRAGLDLFDVRTKNFTHFSPPGETNYFVSSISEDKQGNLWLYGKGNHVYKFNPRDHSFQKIVFADDFNYSFSWGGVLKYDSRGNLWIGSEGGGLIRYNVHTGKKDRYSVENKKLTSNIVFTIIEDTDGRIWIGTDGGGLYKYSYESDTIELLQNDPENSTSLSANGVYYIYESDPGVIWIGVFGGGLNIYKRDKKKFIKFTSTGKPGDRLSWKSVVDMAKGDDGKIWLGTDGGGLNLFDPHTRKFTYYTPENSIIFLDKIISVERDFKKNLWLGSYGKGVCQVDLNKGKIRNFRGDLQSKGETILGDHAWAITETHDHKIWIGLLNYGVNVYDPETDRFTYYPIDTAAFNQAVCNIYDIFEDSKHRVWVGTETSGAGYFDPERKRLVMFRHEENNPRSLSSNHVRGFFEDSRGNIWIATMKGGINKLVDIEKGEFEIYTIKDGLPSNNTQKILEDDRHDLWISTDKGLSCFKIVQKKFINFDIEDGLQSNDFNVHSALKAENGYMFFGGTQGLNMFHPDSIRFNATPPAVVFTDFKIFNHSLKPHQDYNDRIYLDKAIGMSHEITLTYEDYIFSIEFAALDFTSPMKNKYAYRLQGFNDQWTYVNADKRFANYTNLDPGKYVFQVIACNNDGVWNNTGASLTIIILPPWYMTWWFKALSLILATLLIVAFYYIRLRRIREKNKYLEAEVTKRTAELQEANEGLRERNVEILKQQEEILEKKNELEKKKQELEHKQQELEYLNKTKDKFFSIIGHDLKGPVKALTSLTGLLKDQSSTLVNDKQKLLVHHIDTASHKIHNLVVSLLEWARTQSKQVKVDQVQIPVARLFNENIELLFEQASQKQIQFKVETQEAHVVWGDYNMICTIIRNILSNSIKYTPRGGIITLSSAFTGKGEITLAIADNGIGMTEDILTNIFSLEKHRSVKGTDNETGTGLGLVIAKEFAQLNNGKLYAESSPGEGSTFFLVLASAGSLVEELPAKEV